METLKDITIILLPLLIGYFLGKNRDSRKTLFIKKLEIYSNIVYHINSAKELRVSFEVSIEKVKSNIKEIDNLQKHESFSSTYHVYNRELEVLENRLNWLNYKDELIKLFAPARLLGSKAVVDELREYFSLISEHSLAEKKDGVHSKFSPKISASAMQLEQLMRKDLGRFRILSSREIEFHLNHS